VPNSISKFDARSFLEESLSSGAFFRSKDDRTRDSEAHESHDTCCNLDDLGYQMASSADREVPNFIGVPYMYFNDAKYQNPDYPHYEEPNLVPIAKTISANHLQLMFEGKNRERAHPRQVCLEDYQHKATSALPEHTVDIDSVCGYTSNLGIARSGILYCAISTPAQLVNSSVKGVYIPIIDSRNATLYVPPEKIPQEFIGWFSEWREITVQLLAPQMYLRRLGNSKATIIFTDIDKEILSTAMLTAIKSTCGPSTVVEMPSTYQIAKANALANLHERSRGDIGSRIQLISKHIPGGYLHDITAVLRRELRHYPQFEGCFFFFSGKGIKAHFYANSYTELSQQWGKHWQTHIDMTYLSPRQYWIDLGRQWIGDGCLMWDPKDISSVYHHRVRKFKHVRIMPMTKFYFAGLRDIISASFVAKPGTAQSELPFHQFYSKTKDGFVVTGQQPFANKDVETLCFGTDRIEATAAAGGSKAIPPRQVVPHLVATKNRIALNAAESANLSGACREETRVRGDVFEDVLPRLTRKERAQCPRPPPKPEFPRERILESDGEEIDSEDGSEEDAQQIQREQREQRKARQEQDLAAWRRDLAAWKLDPANQLMPPFQRELLEKLKHARERYENEIEEDDLYRANDDETIAPPLVRIFPFRRFESPTISKFLSGRANLFAMGFETVLDQVRGHYVPHEISATALLFLDALRYSVLSKDISGCPQLYKDKWQGRPPKSTIAYRYDVVLGKQAVPDSTKPALITKEGMGAWSNMVRYGYAYWGSKIDWNTWLLRSEHAEHFYQAPSDFAARHVARKTQVLDLDASYDILGIVQEISKPSLRMSQRLILFDFLSGFNMLCFRRAVWQKLRQTNRLDLTRTTNDLFEGKIPLSFHSLSQFLSCLPPDFRSSNNVFHKHNPDFLLDFLFDPRPFPPPELHESRLSTKKRVHWETIIFRQVYRGILAILENDFGPDTAREWGREAQRVVLATNPVLPVPDSQQLLQKKTLPSPAHGVVWVSWRFPSNPDHLPQPATHRQIIDILFANPPTPQTAIKTRLPPPIPGQSQVPRLIFEDTYQDFSARNIKLQLTQAIARAR